MNIEEENMPKVTGTISSTKISDDFKPSNQDPETESEASTVLGKHGIEDESEAGPSSLQKRYVRSDEHCRLLKKVYMKIFETCSFNKLMII